MLIFKRYSLLNSSLLFAFRSRQNTEKKDLAAHECEKIDYLVTAKLMNSGGIIGIF